MKICYLGNFFNTESDQTEEHIAYALEKAGHEVLRFEEKKFDFQGMVKSRPDLFLFHKGGTSLGVPTQDLIVLLNTLTCKKVCWYFDKIWQERVIWAEAIIPYVDHFFLTDEAFMRRHNYDNVHVLRQGIGTENMALGTESPELKNDIVFLGSVYGERQRFVTGLREVYGDKFNTVNNAFGRKLYDLCASTKIFVAPLFPQDDFYWSSRVYMILGSGGFLIHPRLHGLTQELKQNEHIVYYTDGRDLKEKIDYYLTHDEERKKIQMAGYKYVTENLTYEHRVNDLLKVVNEKAS